jgi:hypothetical protein
MVFCRDQNPTPDQILTAPIQLEILMAFKLKSLGLVHLIENQATVSCELYRKYFRELHARC